MCSGSDVLSCHYAAVYSIYSISATLRIFDGLDCVVVVKLVGRSREVGRGVILA